MGKRLFEATSPRHTLLIDKKGKTRKLQDTPKENFIFCKICEQRFQHIETLTAKNIELVNHYSKFKDQFRISNDGLNKTLDCLNINPIEFKIFVYTLVWRASISSLSQFESFKLDNQTENELRFFLNNTLKKSHSELIQSISRITIFPNYHYCIYKSVESSELPKGIFTAFKMAESQFVIFTVDFIFFFYSDVKKMNPAFNFVSNFQNEKIRITLAGTKTWSFLNELVIKKMLQSEQIT